MLFQFYAETLSDVRRVSQFWRMRFMFNLSAVMEGETSKFMLFHRSCEDCARGDINHCMHDSCVIADGIGRGFLSLNFKLPGPKIQVCKDDIIVVDLYNAAEGLSTSIHWHGLRQFGTQFMARITNHVFDFLFS